MADGTCKLFQKNPEVDNQSKSIDGDSDSFNCTLRYSDHYRHLSFIYDAAPAEPQPLEIIISIAKVPTVRRGGAAEIFIWGDEYAKSKLCISTVASSSNENLGRLEEDL